MSQIVKEKRRRRISFRRKFSEFKPLFRCSNFEFSKAELAQKDKQIQHAMNVIKLLLKDTKHSDNQIVEGLDLSGMDEQSKHEKSVHQELSNIKDPSTFLSF